MFISYDLGGGLVVSGQYDWGADGRSGEIGLMPVAGKAGGTLPLQSIVSIAGLNRRLAQAGRPRLAHGEALGGDTALQRVFDEWIEDKARALVQPLVAVNLLINPGMVLVGGRLPLALLDGFPARQPHPA